MKSFLVENTIAKDHRRRVTLKEGTPTPAFINLHRYALVGRGDHIAIDSRHPRNIFVSSSEDPEDWIRVSPHFEQDSVLTVGAEKISVHVTEITTLTDLQSLNYLEQYHYKTSLSALSEATPADTGVTGMTGGRKAVLLLLLKLNGTWRAAGYLELQMPLLMVKPRHDLFSRPFQHPTRPIKWDRWDQHSIKRYVNLIVRIARVVVAPEYRGLSLSKTLIRAARTFCSERWHIGGHRPVFMEISAEMLNYIDFVSSSGFCNVGMTEGNLARVVSDLIHMKRGYSISSGIMSLQKKYLTSLLNYCKQESLNFDEVLARLQHVLKSAEPLSELTADEWLAFRSVIRFPIPYYITGLDPTGDDYLQTVRSPNLALTRKKIFRAVDLRIKLRAVKVQADYVIPQTRHTRLVMEAFGIRDTRIRQTLVGPLDIELSNGNLILIAGSSGSGKSVLLRALDPDQMEGSSGFQRFFSGAQKYSASWLRPLPSDVPLFAYMAERYSPQRAFAALSQVGLSEAFIFLKPYLLLSMGQRYRAMLADLLLRDDPVWLIDEFCGNLDALSARIVAHNLRKQVIRTGRICFVAAANHMHFLDALRPTRIILLTQGADASVHTYGDYRDEFLTDAG